MKNPLAFPAYILALLALAAGCDKPSPPGRLENVGGSSAREPDPSTGGSSGSGGDGGEPALDAGPDVPDGLDAGADAALPDAGDAGGEADAGPNGEEGCGIDSLENECGGGPGCPDLDGSSGPGNGRGPSEECIDSND